ncbi:MAG: S8 family serine peptidase, partial [Kiritimatiellae bacterium]|nr:S8 family serine peptidase [Kiritimatiellia bacterium]
MIARTRSVLSFSLVLVASLALAIPSSESQFEEPGKIVIHENQGQFDVRIEQARLGDVANVLEQQLGLRLSIPEELADQKVTLRGHGLSTEDILANLGDSMAMVFEQEGEGLRLVSAQLTSQQDEVAGDAYEDDPTAEVMRLQGHRLTNVRKDRPIGAAARNPRALALKNALIDTERAARSGISVQVPEALTASEDSEWKIVQFDQPVSQADLDALAAAGFVRGHYVPNNAFAVRVAPGQEDDLAALPNVYHIEPYHPYYKLSEPVLAHLLGDANPEQEALVDEGRFNVVTFHGETDLKSLGRGVTVVKETVLDDRKVVEITAPKEQLLALARNDAVQWLETTAVLKPMNDTGKKKIRGVALQERLPQFTGKGVVIGVTDSGIDVNHQGFALQPGLPTGLGQNTRVSYYINEASVTTDGVIGDNNGHGTHVAGSILGNGALSSTANSVPGSDGPPYAEGQFAGMAPDARAVIIEDFNAFSYSEQVAIAYTNKARLSNNSWGASVYEYTSDSLSWDLLVRDALPDVSGRQEFIAFFAAGNDGQGGDDGLNGSPETVGTPGNAKNVITVGAMEQRRYANNLSGIYDLTDTDWQIASFSSRGPVELYNEAGSDTRIKPDIVAPGVYVLSTQSKDTNPDQLINPISLSDDYKSGNVDTGTNYAFYSGTSMATPLTTGAGALFYEYYTNKFGTVPSPAMMKAALIAGARMVNTLVYQYPQATPFVEVVDQGWGRVDVLRSAQGSLIQPSDDLIMIDQSSPIQTEQFFSQQITVNPGDGGLKVVLTWTDPPGNPANSIQLVNDLDLLVLAPGGGGYIGNRFDLDGVSSRLFPVADPVLGDEHNNVEVVLIPDPIPGTYTIRAYGYSVPEGPQDFAMVIMKGVGTERRSEGDSPAITVDETGQPYVAYSGFDVGGNRNIFVKQWRGDMGDLSDFGEWKRLDDNWFGLKSSASGTGVSLTLEDSRKPTIAVRDGKIYVAWLQAGSHTNIYMRMYDGSNWQELGGSASGDGVSQQTTYAPTDPKIAVGADGLPVIAWRQQSLTNIKIVAKKWNGSSWVGLGGSDVGIGDSNQSVAPTLTINSFGNPVVAWSELLTQLIHVWQWNGAAWVNLGQQGNLPFTEMPHIDAGPNGDLYLTWIQTTAVQNPNQIFASRRTGGSWQAMGNSLTYPGISASTSTVTRPFNPNISYSAQPFPRVFVSYLSGTGTNAMVNVKQYDFATWSGVAGAGTKPGVDEFNGGATNLVMDSTALGVPVVAFDTDGGIGIQETVTYGLVADIIAPTFEGLTKAVGGTNNEVVLTWRAAGDNLSTGITYRIYMGTNKYACYDVPMCNPADVFANQIATVANLTNFTVNGLANYENRCFGVRSVDASGNADTNTVILYAGPEASGVDCFDLDTDNDGLPDWWENSFGQGNPAADPDGDGLTNSNEFQYATDPLRSDSDSDGISDADEINLIGTLPSVADSDGDGLDDNHEFTLGSDPVDADSNDNGVSDGDLVRMGYPDPTLAIEVYSRLYVETFEANSPSRTNWSKVVPNQQYPLNFWHLSDAEPSPNTTGIQRFNDHSTNTSYRMAVDITRTNPAASYQVGTNLWIAGLASPMIDASTNDNLYVWWKEYYDLEPNKDFGEVQARASGDTNWIVVSVPVTGNSGAWVNNRADLSMFAGQSNVQIRFVFTANGVNNQHHGWYVDDVQFISGANNLVGWVRDIWGRPVLGAKVEIIGIGIVTNVAGGHGVAAAGKIFGEAFTAADGSYQVQGLPRGQFYAKASHATYQAEFWNGELFNPTYDFGNEANPGVFRIDDVGPGGIVDLTAGVGPEVDFELEFGTSPSFITAVATPALPVYLNFNRSLQSWNGSTSSPALVALQTIPGPPVDNQADWDTNPVAPNFYSSASAGETFMGLGGTLWNTPPVRTDIRQGELVHAYMGTNGGRGVVFVASLDGISRSIYINGSDTGADTPAQIAVQAGEHLIQIAGPGEADNIVKIVQVPLGVRTNIAFTAADLYGDAGSLSLQTIDVDGNDLQGASIYLNGRLISTNSVSGLSRSTSPATLGGLVAGTYAVSFALDGYKTSATRLFQVVPGESTLVKLTLYEDDLDRDRVGDATEISAFTNRFAQSGIGDADADGFSNAGEFAMRGQYGIELDPNNPDTDGDGMLDGDEVGYDGFLVNPGGHIYYAATHLATNAIEGYDTLRLRFVGRYLEGIWNFGDLLPTVVSVDGDRAETTNVVHTTPVPPTVESAQTVVGSLPSNVIAKAVSLGNPAGVRVFGDTDPSLVDTDGDSLWDGFEFAYLAMTNVFNDVIRILDPIHFGEGDWDPDADELINALEFLGKDGVANTNDWTNPRDNDSDDDLMPDGWEYHYGLDALDDSDALSDEDADGLLNVQEYQNGTDPLLADTDADGLLDGLEILYGADPLNADTDGDRLIDGWEVQLGTDPAVADTDEDGMPDGFEVLDAFGALLAPDQRLNPLDPSDADDDYDGDGLSNLEEYLVRDGGAGNQPDGVVWEYSTNPFNPDTDGDSMPDGWETYYGLHPMDPTVDKDGNTVLQNRALGTSGDLDGDGVWNLREFNIRFYLNPDADDYAILDYSTDPRDPDTDDDGLGDGEEDRIFRSHPHRQDTDKDHLIDGADLTNRWSETESTLRLSEFELIACGTCTWWDAYAMAQVPHPEYTNIFGRLATFASTENGEAEYGYVVSNLLGGGETAIALGATNLTDSALNWNWVGDEYESLDDELLFLALTSVADETNALVMDGTGVLGSQLATNTISHYLVEWEFVPQITNHYDQALNDLWQLTWCDLCDLPSWRKVEPSTNSPLPSPRWGAAATYIPVFETKNPRNDNNGNVLLDNRQLVVFGGRDGVTRNRDVWEFVVRSNMWIKSNASLRRSNVATFYDGLSEFSAVSVFGYKNTKSGACPCDNYDCDGSDFALPKNRPWGGEDDSSPSFDWTYLFGGWDDAHGYFENHRFYKSTDDPRELRETRDAVEGNGVTEYTRDGQLRAEAVNDDLEFIMGSAGQTFQFVPLPDPADPITGFSALLFEDVFLNSGCDEIIEAFLKLEVQAGPAADMDVKVVAEITRSLEHTDPEYESDTDTKEPGARIANVGNEYYVTTNEVNFTITAGFTGEQAIDITEVLKEIITNPAGWDSSTLGFVFEVTSGGAQARIRIDKSKLEVAFIPDYKIDAYWATPSLIVNRYTTETLESRKSVAMAFDYNRERLLLFGGIDGNKVFDKTYEGELSFNGGYDPTTVTWTEIQSDQTPPARYGHSLVYDARNLQFVMFGGFDMNHQPLNDTWIYTPPGVDETGTTAGAWAEVTDLIAPDVPQPRGGASMIYYGDFDYERGL